MQAQDIEKKLLQSIPDAKIKLKDLTGGGDHWALDIETEAFATLSLVEQHQLVYKALGDLMKREIHALALNTKIPSA